MIFLASLLILYCVYKLDISKDINNFLNYIDFEIYNLKQGKLISKFITDDDCAKNHFCSDELILNFKKLLYQSTLNGNTVLDKLLHLKTLIVELKKSNTTKNNLIKILSFKALVCFGFAYLIRVVIMHNYQKNFYNKNFFYDDLLAHFLGFIILMYKFIFIYKLLHKLCFKFKKIYINIFNWLHALFLNQWNNDFELSSQLNNLKLKELHEGISLKIDIQNYLIEYAYNYNLQFKDNLQKISSLFPIIELFSIGLPTILIILIPIIEIL